MNNIVFKPLLIAVIFCLYMTQGSAADLTQGSIWRNDKGSTLTVNSVDPVNGVVTGTFVTGVGCGVGKSRPMTGVFNQGAFSFTVNFEECVSTTSWSGVLNSAGNQIVTLWHLALSGSPKWNSIVAGADNFTKQ